MTFSVTPRGVLAFVPVLHIGDHIFADLNWYEDGSRLLLVLQRTIAIIKSHSIRTPAPLYTVGFGMSKDSSRLLTLPLNDNDRTCPSYQDSVWKEICISPSRPTSSQRETIFLPMNHAFPPLVRIHEHLLSQFFAEQRVTAFEIMNAVLPWTGNPPLVISFPHRGLIDLLNIVFQVGTCEATYSLPYPSRLASVWANVREHSCSMLQCNQRHHCPQDHILTWPGLERKFTFEIYVNGGEDDPPMFRNRQSQWIYTLAFVQVGASERGHLALSKLVGYVDVERIDS